MSWLQRRRLLRSIEKVQILRLEPGDTLVVTVDQRISDETAAILKERLSKALSVKTVVVQQVTFTIMRPGGA